jgi:hypothetical protein
MTASQVTALSAAIGGTTRLLERLGATEATHAIERCLKRMERSVAGHGGHLVGTTEGELLATFDSAEQACLAAIDMQLRVATLPPVSGFKLPIRIGLHGAATASATPALLVATRIASLAENDQILASAALIAGLPPQAGILGTRATPDLAGRDGSVGELLSIAWQGRSEPGAGNQPAEPGTTAPGRAASSLALDYRGQRFLVDAGAPRLSIGRDATCQVVIGDRKASRAHGVIERRGNAFFYVDRSSNGSQVRLAGQEEIRLRHQEIELNGSGRIFFGGPATDPETEFADFAIS